MRVSIKLICFVRKRKNIGSRCLAAEESVEFLHPAVRDECDGERSSICFLNNIGKGIDKAGKLFRLKLNFSLKVYDHCSSCLRAVSKLDRANLVKASCSPR